MTITAQPAMDAAALKQTIWQGNLLQRLILNLKENASGVPADTQILWLIGEDVAVYYLIV